MSDTIMNTPEIKKLTEEFESEWYSNWHEIDPYKSNYITFHQYCQIQDVLGATAARILQQSNDSLKNHSLATIILQGPEYNGSRFIKWLKKKLGIPVRPERMRIILDDKYFTDIAMDVFITVPEVHWYGTAGVPQLQRLIKKLKEEIK